MNKFFLIALCCAGIYGCASSSRVDMIADQTKANQINIKTLQSNQNDYETNILNIHNRMASQDAKISELQDEQKSLKSSVNNLTSKFDSKFRQTLTK